MFTLREINQMEREMCSYLNCEVTVDSSILLNFEMMVKRDFRTPGPYLIRREKPLPIHPLKAKMFAFAIPSLW